MKKQIPVTNFDIIFISYDEDNAELNWADLKKKCLWAKRIHGIKGSDAAHKEAAKLSNTDRFITCDADTIIKPEFFNTTIDKELAEDLTKTISWSSVNHLNGLIYGNGSLKCWTKPFIFNMKTHEESDQPKNQIEFCFEDGYIQSNDIYSITYPNGSPKQAWRSGFREGVKMTLNQGIKIPLKDLKDKMYWKNMIRLLIWCSVGTDVEYGLWAILGARMGCYMTNLTSWDYINVRDFEYLNDMWNEKVAPKYESFDSLFICSKTGYGWNNDHLLLEIKNLGDILRDELHLEVAEFDKHSSQFFRKIFSNPARVDVK